MKRLAKALVIARIKENAKQKPHSWQHKPGPWDRKIKKADGGDVDKPAFDPSQPFQAADQTDSKPAFDPSQPFDAAPDKPTSSWSDAITDIPHEIGSEAGNALDKIKALGNRGQQGPIEGLMTTGKAALAVPQLLASPITGAARSLIGHPMAQVEHAAGTLINPTVAAQDDPQKMYETAKGDVDTAMSAMGGEKPGLPVAASPTPLKGIVAPSTKELFQAADNNYKNARGFGVEIHPQAVSDVADGIFNELHTEGYRDYLAPKTYKAVDELKNPVGQNVEVSDIEGVRKALNKAAADPAERDAARRAINSIDDYVANLNPSDVVVNPQFADRVSAEAQEARGNYAAAKRSEALDAVEKKADRQANSAGSGTNIDNATRQRIKEVLNNPKKLRGFSDEEVAQMEQIIRGTPVGNVARLLGKFAPSGVVSGALSAGAGFAAHGPIGAVALPAAGYAAKKAADASTLRMLAQLKNNVRARSPLGRQNSINAAAQAAFANPARPLMLPGAAQTAAMQSPLNMMQLPGPVSANAQNEQQ